MQNSPFLKEKDALTAFKISIGKAVSSILDLKVMESWLYPQL